MKAISYFHRFLHNKFTDNYTPTIEDFHRKVYRIRGEAYRLDILDTSGNDPFPAMRRLSLLTGEYEEFWELLTLHGEINIYL